MVPRYGLSSRGARSTACSLLTTNIDMIFPILFGLLKILNWVSLTRWHYWRCRTISRDILNSLSVDSWAPLEIWMKFWMSNFQANWCVIVGWGISLWNCLETNIADLNLQAIIWTNVHQVICRHMVSPIHNECIVITVELNIRSIYLVIYIHSGTTD